MMPRGARQRTFLAMRIRQIESPRNRFDHEPPPSHRDSISHKSSHGSRIVHEPTSTSPASVCAPGSAKPIRDKGSTLRINKPTSLNARNAREIPFAMSNEPRQFVHNTLAGQLKPRMYKWGRGATFKGASILLSRT